MYTSKQIAKIAKMVYPKYAEQYEHIGIRVQDGISAQVGETLAHRSSVWIDGTETGDLLDGVCAVSAKDASRYNLGFGAYSGDKVLILGSNLAIRGEDDGELIMCDPVVLAIM